MVPSLSQVLGRVIAGVLEIARGPDVVHRIAVDKTLLEEGAEIALTLPRNLTCAACGGGGCDGCERAGAITLRERGDPPEVLRVILPPRSAADLEQEPVVVLRVPDQGGFPAADSELPRGLLFLKVEASDVSDTSVATALPIKKKSRRPSRRANARLRDGEMPGSQRGRTIYGYVSLIVALASIALALAYSLSLPR